MDLVTDGVARGPWKSPRETQGSHPPTMGKASQGPKNHSKLSGSKSVIPLYMSTRSNWEILKKGRAFKVKHSSPLKGHLCVLAHSIVCHGSSDSRHCDNLVVLQGGQPQGEMLLSAFCPLCCMPPFPLVLFRVVRWLQLTFFAMCLPLP